MNDLEEISNLDGAADYHIDVEPKKRNKYQPTNPYGEREETHTEMQDIGFGSVYGSIRNEPKKAPII